MSLSNGRFPSTAAGVAPALLLVLAATACAPSAPPAPEASTAAQDSGSTPATQGEIAPEFVLNDLDGAEVRLSDSSGDVRLIDFWATWCAPCREEIPMLNELQEIYGGQGFHVLAITDETADIVRPFATKHGIEYTNLLGTDEVTEQYQVLGLPTAFLVDREGRIVEFFVGPKPRSILEKKIQELLGATPSA